MFSGPAARKASIASGRGCLGPLTRPTQRSAGHCLTLINVARAIREFPRALSLLGSSAQYTCCFGDREDAALRRCIARLAARTRSIVWAQKTEIHNVVDHISSNPGSLTTFCRVAATIGGNNGYMPSDLLLILNPEHADVLARPEWTRADVQKFVSRTRATSGRNSPAAA